MLRKLIVDPAIRSKHADVVDQPIVILVQKFDEASVKEFKEQLEKAHSTRQTCIPIVIDSYGGHCYSLLDMISNLKQVSLPIYTVLTGKAMSCGAMLFSMGQRRYMAEDATLMLHEISSGFWGKIEEMKSDTKEGERLNKLIFSIVAKNCGKKSDYFLKLIHEKSHADWYLTAKEAKKHNLCTDIGIPEFTVKVSVDYIFG